MVTLLSEEWIKTCEKLLEQIGIFSSRKDADRLDYVKSIRFSLYAFHRSILGWMNWVNSPDIMSTFNRAELAKMNEQLAKFVESFIKYDVQVTKQGAKKAIKAKIEESHDSERKDRQELFYV